MDALLFPSAHVSALILAGGQSTRMGHDKALLPWRGVPLLQRVVEVAQQCCAETYVITPWPERYQFCWTNSIQWCLELPHETGPVGALVQGLQVVHTPWALLLACDMPQLNPAVLQHWIAQLPPEDGAALAYVPYDQSRWEPLCGLYDAGGRSALESFIAQGGRSFQAWLHQVKAVPLVVDEAIAPMLQNCNTPEDLKANDATH